MKKLSKQEMKNVRGGTNAQLWTCDYVEQPGHFITFCHLGNPTLHTDPTCSDVNTCTAGANCSNPFDCP
jgi:hypothetical protein